jgi:hypothetical protein
MIARLFRLKKYIGDFENQRLRRGGGFFTVLDGISQEFYDLLINPMEVNDGKTQNPDVGPA